MGGGERRAERVAARAPLGVRALDLLDRAGRIEGLVEDQLRQRARRAARPIATIGGGHVRGGVAECAVNLWRGS